MKLKNILIIVLAYFLFIGCSDSGSGGEFTIQVNYKNAHRPTFLGPEGTGSPLNPVKKVYLYAIPFGNDSGPVILDSSNLNADNGTFKMQGSAREEGIFELTFDNGLVVLVSNDAPQIVVDVDLAKKDNYYNVKGSSASNEMKEFVIRWNDYSQRVNQAFTHLDSLKSFKASDSVLIAATDQKNEKIKEINDFLKGFINKTKHPSVALFVLGWASRSFSKQEFEVALNQMLQKFPNHAAVKSLKQDYDRQQAQFLDMEKKQREAATRENLWVGKAAPELSLPDPKGRIVKLSSFKGEYVLVDFWASWCAPCRQENPNLVRAYNTFKDKNFTILGVSIDREKEHWLEAINEDKLTWSHVSDLLYWESKAVTTYKFDGIPYNILVDPQGIVVAESLRGAALEVKLSEVLK